MTLDADEERLNLRIRAELKRDLRIAAELRGLKMSTLIHTLIVSVVREEKERDPKAFAKKTGAPSFAIGDVPKKKRA